MMGSKGMYKNSPKLERDKESGKMAVSKADQSGHEDASAGEAGMPVHDNDMVARHNLERHMMHAKHEHEHAGHKGGGKEQMHERHAKEHHEMLKKHNAEMTEHEETEE